MNPYGKGAALLLRLVALGLLAFGSLSLWLEFMRQRIGKEVSTGRCVLYGVAGLVGLGLLFGSAAVARRLTRFFDE
ncbi:MAG TPA: hypothetical protein PLT00_13730 [Verrucomicrobiota bacterium]|jgi:hypothetical protein|nr:hypothetical protein [Verrucomicrobiota bacterium]OQB92864.1 MAG: hypothetical protein BWX84_00774 [Verrucomicrobia bacterium ADurb.Bin118]HPY31469.1 hypothetical protein [Verrucomicrobiota bacterium]HQB17758.1 hypothetical protein [Verrucomicrobiota bacterium]